MGHWCTSVNINNYWKWPQQHALNTLLTFLSSILVLLHVLQCPEISAIGCLTIINQSSHQKPFKQIQIFYNNVYHKLFYQSRRSNDKSSTIERNSDLAGADPGF